MKLEHSYLIYEFVKCHDEIRKADDPPCKGRDEINEWLKTKSVHLRVLNDKIDFTTFNDDTTRKNEIWMPVLKFKPGLYSDAGYRYRENTFDKKDHWFPGIGKSLEKFYDMTFFSSDEIEVGQYYNTIAEMYIRIKTDSISHERQVFSLMDWLGSIGGIEQILIDLLVFLFGGYA